MHNASFHIKGNSSRFSRLFIAVEAGAQNTARSFSVRNTLFEECYIGIQSHAVNYYTIKENEFQIGGYDLGFNLIDGLGVSVNGTGFTITDNRFIGSLGITIGLGIANTGGGNNHIDHNVYTQLAVGNYASGLNRDAEGSPFGGLEYNCNSNSQNTLYDFYIVGDGIGFYQGTLENAAGSMYQQAELLFQIREESKANLFLNTEISDEIAGVEQLIEDHEDYITVTDLTQSARDTDRDWSELVLEFEGWDILKTLAETKKNIAASQAKHLLNFYLGERYVEIPQLVANSDIQSYSPSGSAAFGNIEVATDNNHTWMAYPNPANNEVNFNYDFSEIQDQVRLQVFNLSGKVIFEQDLIDNSGSINWKVPAYINGVLFYSFSSNDFFSETRKLILLR